MTEEEKQKKDDEYWGALARLERSRAFATSTAEKNLQAGMTLRQYYIGQALQGAMANQFMGICSGAAADTVAEGILLCVDTLLLKMAKEMDAVE